MTATQPRTLASRLPFRNPRKAAAKTVAYDARPTTTDAQHSTLGTVPWKALWFPFWAGSDLRPPALPGTGAGDEPIKFLRRGLEATRFVQWMLEIQDRVWRQRLLLIALRTFWLVCFVELLVCLWGVRAGRIPDIPWFVAPAVVVIAFAAVYTWLQRPTRMSLARFLDNGYGLNASLATGLELARGQLDSALAPQILNRAAGTAYRIGRSGRLKMHRLDREHAFALALPIILAGAAMLLLLAPATGRRGFIPVPKPDIAGATNPQNPADAMSQPALTEQGLTPEQVQQLAVQSAQAQQDLRNLANALNDNSATRQAAQDLQNGDYNRAAQDLQQVASTIDQLSPEARQQLANDLQQASQATSGSNMPLSEAEARAAQALQMGSAAQQQQAVRDLAQQVQQTGGQVRSQGELSEALREANERGEGQQGGQQAGQGEGQGKPESGNGQSNGMNGPGAGLGQPVPYQAGDPAMVPDLGAAGRPVTINGQPSGQAKPLPGGSGLPQPNTNNGAGAGAMATNGQQGQVGAAGPDSNRVPQGRRDIVGGYFTPSK